MFQDTFPNLFAALNVVLTLPLYVASGERSFFTLKIMENYLRSSSIFSALTLIKSKYRSLLKNIENALRPAVSNIAPKLNLLCSKKQTHASH